MTKAACNNPINPNFSAARVSSDDLTQATPTAWIELVLAEMPPIPTASSSCGTGRKSGSCALQRKEARGMMMMMMMMMEQRLAGATTAKDKDKNAPILLSSSSSSSEDGGGGKEAASTSPPIPTKKKHGKAGIEEEEKKKKKKRERRSREGDEEEAPKKRKMKKKNKEDDKGKKMDASCSFPMSRVWRLVRSEGGAATNTRTTPDAVFLINKASEMFLEKFAEDAYATAVQERKKSIAYKHLSSTVSSGKRYEFLSDFVPEKVRAEDALKAKALVET